MQQQYIKLSRGFTDSKFVKPEELYKHVNNFDEDWYFSTCYYTDEHIKIVNERKKTLGKFSVAGLHDLKTNKLWWDLDSEDLKLAKEDTIKLCDELLKKGFKEENLQICFSGRKGFSVIVETDKWLEPKQVESICTGISKSLNLSTFDDTMYDAPQVFRLPLTKHKETGLYKAPFDLNELKQLTIDQIKSYSSSIEGITPEKLLSTWKKASFPTSIKISETTKKTMEKKMTKIVETTDLSNKPKNLSNCRWFLQNGHFKEGSRSHALLCLASTYKNQGFDLEHTYRLLKGVCELQARRTNEDRFPDEELYNNICSQVYSPTWSNGQYSCRKDGWLKNYCESLNENKCKHNEDNIFQESNSLTHNFKNFASNLDKNIIKLGIPGFDEKVTLTTSMLVGLLGAPSAGKTQTSFQILNTASKNNIKTAFYSMDMGLPLVVMRLLQKHTGYSQKVIYDMYKNNKEEELNQILNKEYSNVKFSFKSGLTVDDIRRSVVDYRENTGERLRMIVVDYLECLQSSQTSDVNANLGLIAKQLKDLANEEELLVILLLQTQKHSGDPSQPLLSMRNVKGASALEQDCSVIISIYREGFSALTPEHDKFITISAVKNRMGALCSVDCEFDGLTGNISYPMSDEAIDMLEQIRDRKKQKQAETKTSSSGSWY